MSKDCVPSFPAPNTCPLMVWATLGTPVKSSLTRSKFSQLMECVRLPHERPRWVNQNIQDEVFQGLDTDFRTACRGEMCSGVFIQAHSSMRIHQGVFTKAYSPRRVHQGAFTKATDYNFPMWSFTQFSKESMRLWCSCWRAAAAISLAA